MSDPRTRARLPRGIVNRNPGNLRQTHPRTPWFGQVQQQALTDTSFEQFIRMEYGVRALAKTLLTYFDKRGLRTITQIINRWAPPEENDTASYVEHVAGALGVDVNAPIDMHEYKTMRAVVETIILHENGRDIADDELLRGLGLAGITP